MIIDRNEITKPILDDIDSVISSFGVEEFEVDRGSFDILKKNVTFETGDHGFYSGVFPEWTPRNIKDIIFNFGIRYKSTLIVSK